MLSGNVFDGIQNSVRKQDVAENTGRGSPFETETVGRTMFPYNIIQVQLRQAITIDRDSD